VAFLAVTNPNAATFVQWTTEMRVDVDPAMTICRQDKKREILWEDILLFWHDLFKTEDSAPSSFLQGRA
jgi:hypothetical protein